MVSYADPMSDTNEWKYGYDPDFLRKLNTDFGQHAKTRREWLGYLQANVAEAMRSHYEIPWHQTVVGKVENGTREIKLHEAYALADIYGISVQDLAEGRGLREIHELDFHPLRWALKSKK